MSAAARIPLIDISTSNRPNYKDIEQQVVDLSAAELCVGLPNLVAFLAACLFYAGTCTPGACDG